MQTMMAHGDPLDQELMGGANLTRTRFG
jgi:hypothetical protein